MFGHNNNMVMVTLLVVTIGPFGGEGGSWERIAHHRCAGSCVKKHFLLLKIMELKL